MIREDFRFLGRKGESNAHIVTFSSELHHDLDTACLGFYFPEYGNRNILDDFRMLAIPYGFLVYTDKIEFCPLTFEGPELQSKREILLSEFPNFLTKNRIDFTPSSILKAKKQGSQLSFADVDMGLLYEWGFNATKDRLQKNFELSIENAKDKVEESKFSLLQGVSIKLLAALALQDKGYLDLSPHENQTVQKIIKASQEKYPEYFSPKSFQGINDGILEKMLSDIRSGGCIFTNLTTEMLDHLYQYAFVNKERRKQLGIYATPPKLARMIVETLPIEDIRPETLCLLDGSCGSGNFLVAGHQRLYDLLPVYTSESEKHEYLAKHILGIDQDQFASEIARFSLLHESLPLGNHWKIKTADFLSTSVHDFSFRPSVILTNPPYHEDYKISHRKFERAVPFVEKNLELLCDNGLMAIILPETFLQKPSCSEVRKRILDECEILEIWQLPEGVFQEATCATSVLFLKKNTHKPKNFPVRVKKVLKQDRQQFFQHNSPSFSYIIPNQDNWHKKGKSFVPNMLYPLWKKLSLLPTLGEIAEIRNGIAPEGGHGDHFCEKNPPKGWKKWLNGPSALKPFKIDWQHQKKGTKKPHGNLYVNWPIGLHRPIEKLQDFFEGQDVKIIINARRNPGTYPRLTAAIDDVGYFVSNDLSIIFSLKNNVTLEELVAVLNHPVVQVWIDDHIPSKELKMPLIKQIPIPQFSSSQRNTLKTFVTKVMASSENEEIEQLISAINSTINNAYKLSEDELRLLENFNTIRARPKTSNSDRNTEIFSNKTWIVTGEVQSVHADIGEVRVWLRGFGDDPIDITIPKEMPGWALRSDVAFEAEIPFDEIDNPDWSKLHYFRPLRYSYLTEEELLNRFYE